MALVLKDRVKETTTTTGTGSFSLAGAVTGYDSFGQIGSGNTTYYAVYLDGGSEWEVGIGTYTAPSTLSRDTILASSNSGNKVVFSAGQKTIWCDYPAGKAVYLDASGSISEPIVNISGITGAISTVDTITFDTGYTTALTTGQLGWDGNNTLGLGMSGGNVVQEIGLQTYIYGKASSAITKGQLIKKTGSNGSSGVITFAPTTANMTNSGDIIGIAAESIALNGFGYVVSTGNIKGFDTTGSSSGETWADGDTLYYNPSGNGLMTKTKPSAPNMKTEVAIVINAGSGGSGSVVVEIIHGTQLGGTDSNVQITSPTGGQVISYDQTGGYWKNINFTDGTGITVSEATSGAITVTNTGVTALSAGTGISVSGSTGSVTVTNTAPDQTVSLTGAGTTTVTGTYPNFTITSNDQYTGTVTNVSALTLGTTGTDLSSTVANPTTTPVITLNVPTASATNRGALSSTDWSTFNNKVTSVSGTTGRITSSGGTTPAIDLASGIVTAGTTGSSTLIPVITVDTYGRVTSITTASNPQGTVTSVSGTGSVNGITLSGTVTSSGSLTLGGTLSNVSLTTQVTGTLPVGNGGTGATTLTGVVYGNGTSAFTAATANQIVSAIGSTAVTNATNATNSAITDDNSTNATMYPVWVTANTGNLPLKVSSADITFNPSTGLLNSKVIGASNGIVINNMTINDSYTLPTGYSGSSVGPVTVASGKSITVPSGSRWVVL
jgi:hypothetical protein